MFSLRLHGTVRAAVLLSIAPQAWSAQNQEAPVERQIGLRIEVLEGQGAINNVKRKTAWEPSVQVLDAAGKPVPGAVVTFLLPSDGPGATFLDGSKVLSVPADATGRATARGMRPNEVAGQFDIRVTATDNGRSAATVITQTNASPAEVSSNKSKKLLIGLLIAGGAAGGLAAALGGKGSSSTPATVPPAAQPGTVTPGQPGIGPPR